MITLSQAQARVVLRLSLLSVYALTVGMSADHLGSVVVGYVGQTWELLVDPFGRVTNDGDRVDLDVLDSPVFVALPLATRVGIASRSGSDESAFEARVARHARSQS